MHEKISKNGVARVSISVFRMGLAVPTFALVTMNDMLDFLFPFLITGGNWIDEKIQQGEDEGKQIHTFMHSSG